MNISISALAGNPVSGVSINGNVAVISAPLAVAINFGLKRPTVLSHEKSARADGGAEGVALSRLRRMIQRRFNAKRRKRVAGYAKYLLAVRNGERSGGAPPITLFCDRPLVESNGVLHVPFGAKIVVIDGETQTEARFQNASTNPETVMDPVAFVIWHNISPEHANQLMHDFNTYANPVPEREVAAANAFGALTQAVAAGIAAAGVDASAINRDGSSTRKRSIITSFDRLLAAAAGAANPTRALTHGGIGAVIREKNAEDVGVDDAAIAAVVSNLLTLARQHAALASAPEAVWAVLGARARVRPVTESECDRAIASYTAAPRGDKGPVAYASIRV